MKFRIAWFAAILFFSAISLADTVRATPIRTEILYVAADANSTKLDQVERGREVVVLEGGRGWLRVEAIYSETRAITGWIEDKGVVQTTTPNGDRVLFGEAVESEDQASQRNGRHGAAQDAMRLYYRCAEYFSSSPLAGEAMYRSADIRWQIDKADVMTLPSAKEQQAYLRPQIDEQYMKEVMKKFPGTKWADLAAFHLIDNKLCGEWQAQSKCPAKEADIYENYAKDHPQSPALAEALYDAGWRLSALIEIYKTEDQPKKSEETKAKAIAELQKDATQFPQSDWGARAQRLLFMIEQDMPTYGNAQP